MLWSVVSPSENKQVAGQLALVTGGANGLGRELSRRLAEEGCNIAIADIDLIGAEKTAKEIELKFNVKTKAFKVDVSSYEEVLKLKIDVESSIGTVDILVNNAGLLALMSLEESRPQDIQKVINVNLTSHFFVRMIERKRGHIMATCSMVAKITYPMATAYCATKYGVDGFMNALYDELCVLNQDEFIILTTAYPGAINTRKSFTDMLDKLGYVLPRMTPAYAADAMVNALLQNKRSIIFPFSTQIMRTVHLLGRELSRRLAKEGCNIAIVDVDLIGAEETAEEIELEFNVKTKAFKVDVSSYEEVLKLKNDVESSIGTVDILICQIFLKGMIERKRGHIMATCSLLAKSTFSMSTAYCGTKHGVDGFIKLTTAYPNFVNTRKDLADMLDKLVGDIPRMTPAYTADAMVKALLQNKRSIIIPFSSHFMTLVQVLPDKVMKEAKMMVSTNIKEFMK
ncbi:unnamed protein product [Diamesa hyperborea]